MSNVSKEIAIELVEDGQAGNGIVSVTRTYGISASGTTESDTTSPSDITTWSAGSPTVTTAKPYLWVKEVTVYTDTTMNTEKYYCVGRRGDNGVDAKDVEWAYIRTTTPTPPTILNDSTYTDSNSKTYTADGHLPRVDSTNRTDIEKENSGSSSKYYECTDDPKGVTDYWKYEWEIKRTKGDVGADGSTRTWNYYGGTTTAENTMTLHNNYAESAFIIDIDNDNDQFGTDSDSKVLVEQTRSTTVTLYDGATPQTLKSLTVSLKYENGTTNVPIDVATYTADKDTGKVDVTVKVNNTSNSHTEIQAHITATDTNDRQKTIVFALYKVMGGAPGLTPIICQVAATNKVFSFQRTDANALTPSSRTSQINVARTEGNTTTILDTAQTGLTFSWGFDDETTAQASSQSIGDTIEVTNTNAASHSSVWVELSTGDRETLSIVKDGAKGNPGTNGETPAFLFKWETSVNAPTVTAPNYAAGTNLGGWSKTAPNKVAGKKLWMSQNILVLSGSTYSWKNSQAWSTPVCISGEDGDPGADAKDREWIYQRNNTGVTPGTPTNPIDRTVDDYVPTGWSDNALAIAEDNKYVYASWRDYDTSTELWGDFQSPILWSNWGVQGIDGDGVQYVYKLFNHELTDSERTSNIPTKPSSMTDGEWIPSGWSDDPLAPTSSMPYCYCSTIKKTGGSWASTFDKLGLWSKWADDGKNAIRIDLDNQADIVAVDSDGKVRFNRVVTVKARIYNGGTLQTSGISLPTSASGYMSALAIGGVTPVLYHTSINNSNKITGTTTSVTGGVLFIVWTFAQGTQMTANTTWPATIQLKYSNVTYDAAFSITSSDTDAVYQLKPNKNELAFSVDANNAYTPSELRVKCGYTKDTGSGVKAYEWPSSPTAGKVDDKYWILYRRIDANGVPVPTFSGAQTEGWNWTYGTVSGERTGGEIIVPNTSTNSAVEFCLSPKGAETTTNSDIIDIESIPIVRSGKAGTSPFIADLDNEMDSVACDSSGEAVAQSRLYTKISAFFGSTDVTAQCTVQLTSNSTNGTVKLVSSNTDTGTGTTITSATSMSSSRYVRVEFASGSPVSQHGDVVLSIVHSSYGTRSLTFTVNGVRAGNNGTPATIYNILPSLNEVSVGRGDDNSFTPRYNTLQCGYKKSVGSDISTVTEATGNIDSAYRLFFRRRNRSNQTWETTYYYYNYSTYKRYLVVTSGYSTSGLDVATYDAVEFLIYKNTSNNSIAVDTVEDASNKDKIADKETVSVISDGENGAKGQNSIRLALDNEHEDFIYSESGKVAPSSVLTITATIYDGATPIAGENVGWQIDTSKSSGTEIKNSGNPTTATYTGDCAYIGPLGDLKVNGLTADSAKIVVKAKYPSDSTGQYYYATFSANKTQQDKYDLVAKPNAIAFNDDETWTDKTIAISADRTDLQGNKTTGVTIQTTAVDGLRLYYKYVNANGTMTSETRMSSTSFTLNQTNARAYIGVYFELRLYSGSDYRLCDHETVEIAKSQNGNNAIIYTLESSIDYISIASDATSSSVTPVFTSYKTEGASKTTHSSYYKVFTRKGSTYTYKGVVTTASTSYTWNYGTITASDVDTIVVFALSTSPSNNSTVPTTYKSKCEVPVVKSGDTGGRGASSIYLDLNNEMDSIQYAGTTKVGSNVTSTATLYVGGAPQTATITIKSRTGCDTSTATISNGVVTVSGILSNYTKATVVVACTHNQVEYSAVFVVQKLVDKPKFELVVDKDVVAVNTDTTSSSSETIRVRVYKSEINSNGDVTRTNVTSLSSAGCMLWQTDGSHQPEAVSDGTGSSNYKSGGYYDFTISYIRSDAQFWLTNTSATYNTLEANMYDYAKVPVVKVQNGVQGEKGNMGRFPYYAGVWEDYQDSATFVVSDTATPYFEYTDSGGQTRYAVWKGANGTGTGNAMTKSSMGTIGSGSNWESMVNDFKYLITEALFTKMAKLGSGIFNGDYAFSQEGTIDGYTNVFDNAYTCYYPTADSIKGRESTSIKNSVSQVTNTTWTAVTDSFYAEKGVPYVIAFYFHENGSNYYFKVSASQPTSTTDAWRSSAWSADGSMAFARPYNWGNNEYVKVWCRKYNNSGSSITIDDIRLTTFVPNLAWNWKTGETYSQLGHFVNATVEGVLNNLIQEITTSNYASFGSLRSDIPFGLENATRTLILNPTKVGSFIRVGELKSDSYYIDTICLPCAYFVQLTATTYQSTIFDYGLGLTIDQMHQCVGKAIYILPDDPNSGLSTRIRFVCGGFSDDGYNDYQSMLVYSSSSEDDTRTTVPTSDDKSVATQYTITPRRAHFVKLVCKMARYNAHECIYWELEEEATTLTGTIINYDGEF